MVKKFIEWISALFCSKKKAAAGKNEAAKKYAQMWKDSCFINERWDTCNVGKSSWNKYMGGLPLFHTSEGGFTRFKCQTFAGTYNTDGVHTEEYLPDGKIVVVARFNGGHATWPAIWMSSENKSHDLETYKDYFEIDLSEYYETRPDTNTTYHFPKSMRKECKPQQVKTVITPEEWNEFVCEWGEDELSVSINGKKVWSMANNGDADEYPLEEYQRRFRVILSMQYGSKWLSEPVDNELPLWMDVKSVEYFKRIY